MMRLFLLLLIPSAYSATVFTPSNCGLTRANHQHHVLGGDTLDQSRMPWIVRIDVKVGNLLITSCTGSLLSARHVITAAHCLLRRLECKEENIFSQDKVHVCPHTSNVADDCLGGIHPQRYFNIREYIRAGCDTDDYVILKLEQPVRGAVPVCLPKQNVPDTKAPLQVAGYSNNRNGNQNLRTAVLTKSWACEETDWICTKQDSGTAVCNADSGAPLMRKIEGHYVIVAVVSRIPPSADCRGGVALSTKLRKKNRVEQIQKYMKQ